LPKRSKKKIYGVELQEWSRVEEGWWWSGTHYTILHL